MAPSGFSDRELRYGSPHAVYAEPQNQDVCLKAHESIPNARASLAKHFDFYNNGRRHQALVGRQTPWQAYTGMSLGQALDRPGE